VRSDDGLLELVEIPGLAHYGMLFLTSALPRIQAVVLRRTVPSWTVSSFDASWSGRNALQVDGEGRRDLIAEGSLKVSFHGKVRMLSGNPVR